MGPETDIVRAVLAGWLGCLSDKFVWACTITSLPGTPTGAGMPYYSHRSHRLFCMLIFVSRFACML